MIFHVSLKEAEDGWIVEECPALPGCVSQGKDEKEALENIKEAITAWLWQKIKKQQGQCLPTKRLSLSRSEPRNGNSLLMQLK